MPKSIIGAYLAQKRALNTLDAMRRTRCNWAMVAVHPYKGVGSVRFGGNEQEVRSLIGDPVAVRTNRLGERELDFEDQVVRVSPTTGVVEISILPQGNPSVLGIEVFGREKALQRLLALDDAPQECVGFLIFLKLGLAITGLHDGDESQRAVTAFARGHWDELTDKMKPFLG